MNIRQLFAQWKYRRKRDNSAARVTLQLPLQGVRSPLTSTLYSWPFPHATIDDFFSAERARALRVYFQQRLHSGTMTEYKKYDLLTGPEENSTNSEIRDVFRSVAFKEMVAHLFNIELSPYVTSSLHNNKPRSSDKYVHTDAIPIIFREQSGHGIFGPNLENSGVSHIADENVSPIPDRGFIKKMRVATLIYYLSPDWEPGMGGETGIFYKHEGRDIECAAIEPRYNRVLLFQNSPTAFHNYKACKLPNRNSLIQWFHD